jgi:L-ascorbate metabolism protein UlaG (beta-lactamase superfamily)
MTPHGGRSLTRQVDALRVPPGWLALWALGQSGFVIKGGDTVVYIDPYHAGDTILYDGLVERLRRHALDIACVPVNGRDGWR